MSSWSPTHVQFTVLRARNLISKGKGGNNDVFVTIQLGKEKYQTSTIKNALHPEWFEECDLPIPSMQAEIEVTLFHRGVISDDFLGYAAISVWQNHRDSHGQGGKSQWITLRAKPSAKSGSSSTLKNRGELEVKLTFHCQNQTDTSPQHTLKKQRPTSIKSFAMAFGDKLSFLRTRSFRENRKDPEGSKLDKGVMGGPDGSNGTDAACFYLQQQQQQIHRRRHFMGRPPPPSLPLPLPPPSVHFPALDINRIYWPLEDDASDGLTRSYSLSAAYIKSMSLDRQAIATIATNSTTATNYKSNNSSNVVEKSGNKHRVRQEADGDGGGGGGGGYRVHRGVGYVPGHYPEHGVNQLHSQSMYNLPGSRNSYNEPIFLHRSSSSSTTTTAPPPYEAHPHSVMLSKDDCHLYSIPKHHRRSVSEHQISMAYPPSQTSPNPGYPDAVRDLPRPSAVYESIKERTEPENSATCSSSSDLESVPKPKPKSRGKRFNRRDVPVMGSSGRDYAKTAGLTSTTAPPPIPPPPHSASSSSRLSGAPSSTVNISASSFSSSLSQQQLQQQQLQHSLSSSFSIRDSGIVEDRSSSQANSHDGSSFATPDGTLSSLSIPGPMPPNSELFAALDTHQPLPSQQISTAGSNKTFESVAVLDDNNSNSTTPSNVGNGYYHIAPLHESIPFQMAPPVKEPGCKLTAHSQFFTREALGGHGDFVVRKRTRGQRDRLRQLRQDNRRVTVQGLSNHQQASSGLYDDSLSDFSDCSRTKVSENLISAYKNMTKEELLRVAIQTKAQMIRKDQYIKDLENYIDDLLVRVMETTPRLLTRKGQQQHHQHHLHLL